MSNIILKKFADFFFPILIIWFNKTQFHFYNWLNYDKQI